MKNSTTNSNIKKSIAGSKRAQLWLYDNYCNAMFTVCYRYLNNTEDAKDIMQEGFIKAFKNLDQFNYTVTFGYWLKRIMINTAIDYLKKQQPITISFDEIVLETPDTNDWIIDTPVSKAQIIEAIQALPETYKLITNLYLIEGYDHEEISNILNIPVKTSRTQLHRARLKLRTALETLYHEARH